MPEMCGEMPERMGDMVRSHPELASVMPEMMAQMCPKMIEKMAPLLPDEKREAFAVDLVDAVVQASGEAMGAEQRRRLTARIAGEASAAVESV